MDSITAGIILFFLYVSVFPFIIYIVFGGFIYGAMWMKLPKHRVLKMLELGEVSKGKVVYDLGSGYGNIAFEARKSGASIVAIEADWFKAWWIKRQAKNKQLQNFVVIKGNLLDVDLREADVLLCYLSDSLMNRIVEKPLKHNSVIVSACHKIKGWTPKLVDRDGIYPIYVYSVP